MSVLDVLRQGASIAGAGYKGYAEDQDTNVREALASAKAQQEAERNRVLNLLTQKEIARQNPGDAGFPQYKAAEIATTAPATTAANVADITATAQPKANAALTEFNTLEPAKRTAAVATQGALLPGEVSKAGQVAAATAANTPATNVITSGTNDEGKNVIVTGKNKGNPDLKVTGIGKPETGGLGGLTRGLGPGGVIGAGSGLASIEEMDKANPNMKKFEQGLLGNVPTSQLGALDRFRSKLAEDIRTHGMISAATATEAERELALTNPALATYGRNLKQWVIGDLNTSRGATDERQRLDMAVSGLAIPLSSMSPADRATYLNQTWEGRDARLAGLKRGGAAASAILDRVAGQAGGGRGATPGGGGSSSGSPQQQLWDAAVKLHGEAKVLKEYGPRPPE